MTPSLSTLPSLVRTPVNTPVSPSTKAAPGETDSGPSRLPVTPSAPPCTLTPPVNVSSPASTRVPEPCRVRPPGPLMALLQTSKALKPPSAAFMSTVTLLEGAVAAGGGVEIEAGPAGAVVERPARRQFGGGENRVELSQAVGLIRVEIRKPCLDQHVRVGRHDWRQVRRTDGGKIVGQVIRVVLRRLRVSRRCGDRSIAEARGEVGARRRIGRRAAAAEIGLHVSAEQGETGLGEAPGRVQPVIAGQRFRGHIGGEDPSADHVQRVMCAEDVAAVAEVHPGLQQLLIISGRQDGEDDRVDVADRRMSARKGGRLDIALPALLVVVRLLNLIGDKR